MRVTERAKVAAGRWMDRHYLPPTDLPTELPMPSVPVFLDIPFSTPRAARTLMVGDEVWVGGRWVAVTRAEPGLRASEVDGGLLPAMFLTLANGSRYAPRYEALLLSRDAEEQTQAAGGSDGC